MEMLYHIGDKRFIIKNDDKMFIVSLSPTRSSAVEIDETDAQSILRQGYWQEGYELNEKLKETIVLLIH